MGKDGRSQGAVAVSAAATAVRAEHTCLHIWGGTTQLSHDLCP